MIDGIDRELSKLNNAFAQSIVIQDSAILLPRRLLSFSVFSLLITFVFIVIFLVV